jgi:glycosyltransferase involved in cell wall biosynthesis
LSQGLVEQGHTVSLVTTDLDGPLRLSANSVEKKAIGSEIDLAVARTWWPRAYGFAPRLIPELRRRIHSADLVHIHGLYKFHTVAASRLARHYSVPYVIHIHGALTQYHRSKKRWKKGPYEALIERHSIEGAAAVIAASRAEKDAFTAWMTEPRCVVVPYVIDSELFSAADSTPRNSGEFGTSFQGDPVVTFVGRLTEKKGLDVLVDAFGQLVERYPDARLVIAGPDDEGIGQRLTRQARRMGVLDQVVLPGVVTGRAKYGLLRASDLMALPSKDESFGVSIAEALAVGVPVVVTEEVALAGEVRDAGAGKVAVRDGRAFAEAMAEVLGDDRERSVMAKNARRLALRFSSETVIATLESVYHTVTAQGTDDRV